MEWQPIETAPRDGTPMLVHYMNRAGKGRTVKAFYADKFTVEATTDDECVDYDEEQDMYFWPPGWYEMIDNWDDYSGVAIHEGVPEHWMPLPPPPVNDSTQFENRVE